MKEDPPLDARCRDKFLVQSVLVDDSEESNVATLWSNVEKTNKGSIQEQKIRVSFLPPAGSESTQVNGAAARAEPASTTSASAYNSPAPASSIDAKSPSMGESPRSTTTTTKAPSSSSHYAAVTSGSPMSTVPKDQEDLNQQLSVAQAKIKELSNQLADPEVRQRKLGEAQEKVQVMAQQAQSTGVPLPYVAVLCLVSFLIAYMFF